MVAADGHAADFQDEVVDLPEVAVLGDKIVGVDVVTYDEHGPGVLPVKPLPSPQEPTPAERERHNVSGHIKYASWCPMCVACRRPNDHHRLQLHDDRTIPLLVGDGAFIRNS